MTKFDYDLFVIGGGSGGVRAGRLTAASGRKVAIAEEYRFGGTCVIRGCVPKKLLVYASHFHETFEDAGDFGWSVGESRFDWTKLIANKDREITRLEGLYRKGLENAKADIFNDRAELAGPHEVRLVSSERIVTAERILVATGGAPNRMINLPGHEHCITSDDAFHLAFLPESIIINGAGYIAVEFACIFAGLGVRTTLLLRGDHILRGFDHDVSHNLRAAMEARGARFVFGRTLEKVEKQGDTLLATLDDGTTLDARTIMLATGRMPNTLGLGLENAGVTTGHKGEIKVDEYSRTNVPHILAVGDVTDRVALTPVAIHEAMCLFQTEFMGNPVSPDHDLVPTAVFSQPEIGTVGKPEHLAAMEHDELNVFLTRFRPMKHTLGPRQEKTMMKIIADAKTDRVVGVHILGPDSGELAQVLGIAVKMGATKADFDRTMAVHPTAAEELVTMYSPTYRIVKGERIG